MTSTHNPDDLTTEVTLRDVLTGQTKTVTIVQPSANRKVGAAHWRFSPAIVERYAPLFREALSRWPDETQFQIPKNMSPNTFEHRFRDARKALRDFRVIPDLADALEKIDFTISLAPDGKSVWFRARGAKPGRPITVGSASARSLPVIPPKPLPSPEDLRQICSLYSRQLIPGPIPYFGRIDAETLAALETDFDLGFAYDERMNITTIL